MHNNNAMTDMGGAIYAYNAANINIAANSAVYNNTAKTAVMTCCSTARPLRSRMQRI